MNKIDINISGVCEDAFVFSVLESLKIGASEIVKLREKISALSEEKETLSNDIQELNLLLEESNKIKSEYQSKIENLQKQNEELIQKIDESNSIHKEECSNLEHTISDYEDKLSSSEKELNNLQAVLDAANDNIGNLKDEKNIIIQENNTLNSQAEIYVSRIDVLELAIVKILSDCCLDIVKVLSTITDSIENESLRDYISKIIMGKDGSEIKGLSKFSELGSLDQVYRNVSLENTPMSSIATMLLWCSNEALCDVIGGVQAWDSINGSFRRFESILEMVGISIGYPKVMSPDDSWLNGAKTDYNRTMHDLFKTIFGLSITTEENCPIFVRRLSSKYGDDIKEGICYIA